MGMHISFMNHARHRYLRLAVVLVIAAIAAYLWHDPQPTAHGGTWLGFTLGGLSAAIILLLLWLGIRKRRYRSRAGTLRGWLSAHIYLGLSLIVLATLHSGFQFHWNIHTLTYLLMMAVILSGVWGMVLYLRYPALMTTAREQQSREVTIALMQELDDECLRLADQSGAAVHEQVSRALTPLRRQGRWTRIRGRQGSAAVEADRHFNRDGETWRLETQLAETLAQSRDAEQVVPLRELIETIGRRRKLSVQLGRNLSLKAQMEIWLLLHIPLSIALLAALLSHVISVFFYR